jgi:hypothetical protein
VPLSRLALAPLLLLPRLAPLGKEAKELLPDKSALLLLSAAAVVVTTAFAAGIGGNVLTASGGTVGFFWLAITPAMVPPTAAAPATPTIGPQMAALFFFTGAQG